MVMTQSRPKSKNKCIICNERPARRATSMCPNCENKIEHEKRLVAAATKQRNPTPDYFITYRGNTIKGIQTGAVVSFVYYSGNTDKLPNSKVIDLNVYLPQFDKEQVKKFKAAVAKLSPAIR